MTLDRAAVVAGAVVQMVKSYLRTGPKAKDLSALHAAIADYLRDEFADAAQQAINDIRQNDG